MSIAQQYMHIPGIVEMVTERFAMHESRVTSEMGQPGANAIEKRSSGARDLFLVAE
jgi:hypothetical protein